MRISDWSSDVCSSDLKLEICQVNQGIHPTVTIEEKLVSRLVEIFLHMIQMTTRDRPLRPCGLPIIIQFAGISHSPQLLPHPWIRDFPARSEEHTSELQSLMRISYAVFCLKKNTLYILRTKHTL